MKKLFLLVLVCLPLLYFYWPTRGDEKLEIGYTAPSIEHVLASDEAFSLSQLKGHYVVVDFWASWCPPCLHEAPELVRLYKDYKVNGLEVVSVALEKRAGRSKNAAERLGFTWPFQIEEAVVFVRLSELASAYKVTEVPTKFLIDPKGNILKINPTFEEIRKFLDKVN